MRFFLGTHKAIWLQRTDVPLFVSRRTLAPRKRFPRALGPWALDSGGFTELNLHGEWTVTPQQYAWEVARFAGEIGNLVWAAPQDWMCEPAIRAKTKLSVAEHQERTIDNLLRLRELAPDLNWAPVLQGWTWGEYEDHREAYERRGIPLRRESVVGIGSVCRRGHTIRVGAMIECFAREGLRLHAFGFKMKGLHASGPHLTSADSMAWSYAARREGGGQNDLGWALAWRDEMLTKAEVIR